LINDMIHDGTLAALAEKYNLLDLYNFTIKSDSKSDLNYIMSKGEMIVGIDGNRPPMTYTNDYGELTGFDIEFAKMVCSNLGVDVSFKKIDWSLKESELNNKTIDCVWDSLTVSEERRKIFKFSYVYLSNQQVIIIRKTDAEKYTNAESLTKATLSTLANTSAEYAILTHRYLSKAKYIPKTAQLDVELALLNAECDAMVIDSTLANGVVSNYPEFMVIKGLKFQEEEYAIGFRYNSDLTDKVDNIILDMNLDDSLTELAEKFDLLDLFTPVKVTDASYIMNKEKNDYWL